MSTARVLVIAYHFPPVGGAGVQRAVKFVRYLPELGWEPVVITGPPGSIGDAGLADPTLVDELPQGLEVQRLGTSEPMPAVGWRGRAERWLRLPTSWSQWWTDGVIGAGKEVKGVDVIFATMSPFESCAAAAVLARRLGIPWVADLRDPWALDEMRVYPSAAHRWLELRKMRRALSSAAAVVMNTPEAERQLRRAFPELGQAVVQAIPNGYDSADFPGERPARPAGPFRIVHTGYLHTSGGLRHRKVRLLRRALGGSLGDVDILTRSHVFLLDAVERLLARRPELRGEIEVHLAGGIERADEEAIRSDFVRLHGYLAHAEVVKLMRTADLLFVPMHDLPSPRRARIVPGKTYEYLASGTPILAAVPDGDARDLLARGGSAILCRPSDAEAMSAAIEREVDRHRRGEPAARTDEAVLAKYDRRALTARLAEVLTTVARAN